MGSVEDEVGDVGAAGVGVVAALRLVAERIQNIYGGARAAEEHFTMLELENVEPAKRRAPDPGGGSADRSSGRFAEALADHLMTAYKTAVVPIKSGKINGIRIAFCSVPEGDIPKLVANLGAAIGDLG